MKMMKKMTILIAVLVMSTAAVFAKPVAVNKTYEENGAVLTWVSTDTEVDSYNFNIEVSTENWNEPEVFAKLFDIAEYEENTVYTFSFADKTISFVLDGDTYRIAM